MAALTRLMQAFAREKVRLGNGRGTGLAAARAAGYQGNENTLRVRASQLSKDPRIRVEMARLRAEAKASASKPARRSPKQRKVSAVALTLGRKLRLLAEIAEDQTAKDSDRIRAIELASKLDGELGGGRAGDVEVVAAAAAQAQASATIVMWVGNGRGPGPEPGVVGG